MWSILKGDGLAPVRFTRPARTLVRCVRIVEPQYRELWHPMVRTAPPIILTSFTLFTRMTRRMAGCGGISRLGGSGRRVRVHRLPSTPVQCSNVRARAPQYRELESIPAGANHPAPTGPGVACRVRSERPGNATGTCGVFPSSAEAFLQCSTYRYLLHSRNESIPQANHSAPMTVPLSHLG